MNMMNRFVLSFVVVVGCAAGAASAQTVPQTERSVIVEVGTESLSLPVLQATLAPKKTDSGVLPLLRARVDLDTAAVGLGLGLQLDQRVCSGFFVREAAVASGFVSGLDGVAFGATGDVTVQAGFNIGSVVLATGPALSGAFVVYDGVSAGEVRLTPAWNVALVVPVVDHVAIVGEASAGNDFGGHGDGAVHGSVFVGARLTL